MKFNWILISDETSGSRIEQTHVAELPNGVLFKSTTQCEPHGIHISQTFVEGIRLVSGTGNGDAEFEDIPECDYPGCDCMNPMTEGTTVKLNDKIVGTVEDIREIK